MSLPCLSTRARSRIHIFCVCAVLCASSLCSARSANAQDLAEAARQEKARKAAQPQKQSHVYTNEDLKRLQILTPEDRAPIEAHKKNSSPPPVKDVSPANVPAQNAQEAATSGSLGEIARRLRAEKAARQAEQARKLLQPAPFQLDLPPDATLAHPKPPVRPLVAPALPPARIVKPPVKRDPFSRAVISSAPVLKPAPPHSSSSVAVPSVATSTVVAPSVATPTVKAPALPVFPAVVPPATVRAPAIIPSSPRPDSIRIQPGDSLWNLSRQYLGKGSRWQEWLTLNPNIDDPRRLQLGAVLLVPKAESVATPRTETPSSLRPDELQPAATISVQPGDSLWRIAAAHLGNGANWPCLAQANLTLHDVSLIYPGQTLFLPASCTEAKPLSAKN